MKQQKKHHNKIGWWWKFPAVEITNCCMSMSKLCKLVSNWKLQFPVRVGIVCLPEDAIPMQLTRLPPSLADLCRSIVLRSSVDTKSLELTINKMADIATTVRPEQLTTEPETNGTNQQENQSVREPVSKGTSQHGNSQEGNESARESTSKGTSQQRNHQPGNQPVGNSQQGK